MTEIPLGERRFALIAGELTTTGRARLRDASARGRTVLAGRRVWHVNSTPQGGGVAEMLRTLLPYWRGEGIDARWLVMSAPAEFFSVTRRLHDLLHGSGVERWLGLSDRALYERVCGSLAAGVVATVRPGDVVVLHDPQTAGLAPALERAGVIVVWRCHVGSEVGNESVRHAWQFLLPYVGEAHLHVFTRPGFVPRGLADGVVRIVAPAIDPCSPKNQVLAPDVIDGILTRCGLVLPADAVVRGEPMVTLAGGGVATVRRPCRVLREGAPPTPGRDRLVVALSRWDRLKDPAGIIHAFADHVDDPAARLLLAGPSPGCVADDPLGAAELRRIHAAWRALPVEQRSRIDIAVLPMVDLAENGLIVNALQRRAAIVVKKSVQEGFGLGVTEALWKARPVVATRVGGHQDQLVHNKTGLLVGDPSDLRAFAAAVTALLNRPEQALALGLAGREVVRERFLADRHFAQWMAALEDALDALPADVSRRAQINLAPVGRVA